MRLIRTFIATRLLRLSARSTVIAFRIAPWLATGEQIPLGGRLSVSMTTNEVDEAALAPEASPAPRLDGQKAAEFKARGR